jgi:hypothetical protein
MSRACKNPSKDAVQFLSTFQRTDPDLSRWLSSKGILPQGTSMLFQVTNFARLFR